jgi:hypothetical protein
MVVEILGRPSDSLIANEVLHATIKDHIFQLHF